MIRLTVLYNLAPGTDEDEFLRWRLTEHQDSNLAMEGVVRTDFTRVDESWPQEGRPPYRYITTVDWPDWDSFRTGFYDPGVQAGLARNMRLMGDPLFLIGEVLVEQTKGA